MSRLSSTQPAQQASPSHELIDADGRGRWQAWLLPGFAIALWALAIWNLSADWTRLEQYHFGWLVPLLTVYLVKVRMERQPAPDAMPKPAVVWSVLLGISLLAILGMPVQTANPDSRLLDWWFAGLAAGATLVTFWQVGGRRWVTHFAFPFFFFFIAVPLPARIESPAMQWLMRKNAVFAVEVLHWMGISSEARGNLISLPNCTLGVDEACSGIRSLQGTLMLTLFLGEIFALRWPRRVVLLAAGFCWALLTNVGRTLALSLVGVRGGLPAVDRWHDTAGYTVLAVCSAAVALMAWRLRPAGHSLVAAAPSAAMDLAAISRRLRAVAPCGMAGLAILAAGFGLTELWFRAHEQANVAMPAWSFRFPSDDPTFKQKEITLRTRAILGYDEGRSGQWRDNEGKRWQALFFHWLPYRNSPQDVATHDPRSCLAAVGMEEVAVLTPVIIERGDLYLTFDGFHFRDGPEDLFVFNCLADDIRHSGGDSRIRGENSLRTRLAATIAGKRKVRNVAQRRLEVAVWGAADGTAATEAFRRLIEARLEIGEHPVVAN